MCWWLPWLRRGFCFFLALQTSDHCMRWLQLEGVKCELQLQCNGVPGTLMFFLRAHKFATQIMFIKPSAYPFVNLSVGCLSEANTHTTQCVNVKLLYTLSICSTSAPSKELWRTCHISLQQLGSLCLPHSAKADLDCSVRVMIPSYWMAA